MWTLVAKEIRDALRHRWLQSYAALLAAVGLVAAHAAWSSSSGLGLQSFGRTTATLTNFCLLLAPLVALTMGAAGIAGERDRNTLDFLLSQPLERSEILLGKYLGLAISSGAATLIGFAPAAFVVLFGLGGSAALRFTMFPALAALLVAAMLGLGLAISVMSRSAVQAQGRATFAWFLFVLLYDLLLMGTLLAVELGTGPLVALLLLNPVDCARILVVLGLEPDLHLLGPAGAFLFGELGGRGAAALLLGSVLAWTVLPLVVALRAFRLKRSSRTGTDCAPVAEAAELELSPSSME
jgi:Cu-processing system permease protein